MAPQRCHLLDDPFWGEDLAQLVLRSPGCVSGPTCVLISLQVARAGRFGTKGLAITFVSDENDAKILNDVQDRFEVNVAELPEEIDISTYSKWLGQERWAGVQGPLLSQWPPHVCLTVEQSR